MQNAAGARVYRVFIEALAQSGDFAAAAGVEPQKHWSDGLARVIHADQAVPEGVGGHRHDLFEWILGEHALDGRAHLVQQETWIELAAAVGRDAWGVWDVRHAACNRSTLEVVQARPTGGRPHVQRQNRAPRRGRHPRHRIRRGVARVVACPRLHPMGPGARR